MKNREIIPLALLAADGAEPIEGRTRLQKFIFLAQQELKNDGYELEAEYDFVPYDYGPFAKEIYDDVEELKRRDLVKEESKELDDGVIKYDFVLTKKGEEFVEGLDEGQNEIREKLGEVKNRHSSTELQELIDQVYSEYPGYAENSVLY